MGIQTACLLGLGRCVSWRCLEVTESLARWLRVWLLELDVFCGVQVPSLPLPPDKSLLSKGHTVHMKAWGHIQRAAPGPYASGPLPNPSLPMTVTPGKPRLLSRCSYL